MMKKISFWLLICGLLTSVGFISCGDDDDDAATTGKAALKIGDKGVGLDYAYWYCDLAQGSETANVYHLEFYSFDITKIGSTVPSAFSIVYIDIETTGSINEIPVGTFPASKYNVYVVLGSGEDDQYEIDDNNASNGNLIITKENGTYKVNLSKVFLIGDGDNKEASFSYNGGFSPVPEGWHDND